MQNKKLSLGNARALALLLEGECVASSKISKGLAEEMLKERLLMPVIHGSHRSYRTDCPKDCRLWLYQRYGIEDLHVWIAACENQTELCRAEQVRELGDSKLRKVRTFKGFLVNVCEPVDVLLNGIRTTLQPTNGLAYFIQDFEHFIPDPDACIIGMENGENFQHLKEQRHLFEDSKVIFVSRYPQSTDLRSWLQQIPNPYIHFGDFDLAGIHIFLNEFYAYLGERSRFFIPSDIEERLKQGNRNLYNDQYLKFKDRKITDQRLEGLVHLIQHYGKVYEQEGYIESES